MRKLLLNDIDEILKLLEQLDEDEPVEEGGTYFDLAQLAVEQIKAMRGKYKGPGEFTPENHRQLLGHRIFCSRARTRLLARDSSRYLWGTEKSGHGKLAKILWEVQIRGRARCCCHQLA
jgi:hypothetical protein